MMWLRQMAQLSTTMSAENEVKIASGSSETKRNQAGERGGGLTRQLAAALTPGPERDGVPLLDLEALVLLAAGAGAGRGGHGGGHGHGDVALVHRERNPRRAEREEEDGRRRRETGRKEESFRVW
jgi:hypothetical protein